MILDNNGIIQKSKEARSRYGEAKANEEEQLDQISSWIDKQTGDDETSINWEELIKDANSNPNKYKHPDQSSTNADVGIGTDGNPVNMDLWTYQVINENEIQLGQSQKNDCFGTPGYENSKIINGKIQGKVPQYIKLAANDSFYTVTSAHSAFMGCTNLVIAPELPKDITDMTATFRGCTNLTQAPKIPSKVTNLWYTFFGCSKLSGSIIIPESVKNMVNTFIGCESLLIAPKIPENVESLDWTFAGCTNLKTAPEIPESVTDLGGTFINCTNLTGNLIINANPTFYESCLLDAATADNANLVVSGSSTVLDEIIATKGTDSHITKAQ